MSTMSMTISRMNMKFCNFEFTITCKPYDFSFPALFYLFFFFFFFFEKLGKGCKIVKIRHRTMGLDEMTQTDIKCCNGSYKSFLIHRHLTSNELSLNFLSHMHNNISGDVTTDKYIKQNGTIQYIFLNCSNVIKN